MIASKAHLNQTDKSGQPYILHVLRVMLKCSDKKEQICAVLHDSIEDSDLTLSDLISFGFDEEILTILDCLTKRKGEDYDLYISRILENDKACKIKLLDLSDNMNLSRIPNPSQKDYIRQTKYINAKARIIEKMKTI